MVHYFVARHAGIVGRVVLDEQTFDELGLDALDLVLIVIQLQALAALSDDVPLQDLEHVGDVGALVALIDAWRGVRTLPFQRTG
jgi:acyl carrier protein